MALVLAALGLYLYLVEFPAKQSQEQQESAKRKLVTLEEQAALAGTISYELLTSLGSRLPRIYQQAE